MDSERKCRLRDSLKSVLKSIGSLAFRLAATPLFRRSPIQGGWRQDRWIADQRDGSLTVKCGPTWAVGNTEQAP